MEDLFGWVEQIDEAINQLILAGKMLQVYVWVSGMLLVLIIVMLAGISATNRKINDEIKILRDELDKKGEIKDE